MNVQKELNRIKTEIEKMQIDYGDIFFLQCHKRAVYNTGDIVLMQWAGITEEEYNSGKIKR